MGICFLFVLGQAFYAGGSERSGQQIIGPPKPKDNDKKVTKIFEAARKQGAMEADEDEDGPSPHAKKEKAFVGRWIYLRLDEYVLTNSSILLIYLGDE